jgi:tetratricopeptide (TPR) repeat protein
MHNRKWEEAEQASKWAVALNPRLAPARKNLAWTLVELGRKEEGIFQMEKGIISRPDFAPLWEDLALLYQSEGNLAEADKAILRAMTLKPESAPILNRAGIIAYLRQQHREAKEWFLDAIQIDPSPVYRFNLAITQKQLGEKPDIVGMPRNLKLTSDVIPPQIREVPC